jgi:hypothetical protein
MHVMTDKHGVPLNVGDRAVVVSTYMPHEPLLLVRILPWPAYWRTTVNATVERLLVDRCKGLFTVGEEIQPQTDMLDVVAATRLLEAGDEWR